MFQRLIDAVLYPEYSRRDKSMDYSGESYQITDSGSVVVNHDALEGMLSRAAKEVDENLLLLRRMTNGHK